AIPAPAPGSPRRSCSLFVRGSDMVLVDGNLEAPLGLTQQGASQGRQAVQQVLRRLADDLQGQDVVTDLVHQVLEEPFAFAILTQFRGIGAAIRSQLSPNLIGHLRSAGLLAGGAEEVPTLEVIEAGAHLPWEFLHEGSQIDDPDWRKFWGFRSPITHWPPNMS